MADVKIIDIDGEQWNIKDQDARSKIITLETEITKLKTIEKWEYTIPTYGGHVIARRQCNIVSITANGIGTAAQITEGMGIINFVTLPERFRPSEMCLFMLRVSGSLKIQYGGIISQDGKVRTHVYENIKDGLFSVSYIVD